MKLLIRLSLFLFMLTSFSCVNIKSQTSSQKDVPMNAKHFTYLALGDSYTIGEGVEESGRYPNQVIGMLNSPKTTFSPPLIIAKTGWTTDELAQAILDAGIAGQKYDLVTLLIGVNNQYRGRPVENFIAEFSELLKSAINFADGNTNQVIVISIPDWGVTPFAASKEADRENVTRQINSYNAAKRHIATEMGVHYVEITEDYRDSGGLPEMLVSDQLHPSAFVYQQWADKIRQIIVENMAFIK